MKRFGPVIVVVASALGSDTSSSAQSPVIDPLEAVRIVSPEPNSFLAGVVELKADVDRSLTVSSVAFYVDGRQVCTFTVAPFVCEWDAGSEVVAHQVRAVFSLPDGDRVARTVRTKSLGFADKVNVEIVQVTITVTDDSGKFIPNIPRDAFRVWEDGAPQTITYFSSEDVPLELIVAVDISGSMTRSMPKLKLAVKEFLRSIPGQHQVTLLGFNDTVFPLARKATDPLERVRAVDRLSPWGATALYDAIMRGVEMLGRQTGRKALVVFSDGEDQGSHVALQDVERRLQSSDVTLYMIGQGRGITQDYLRKTMQRLTVPTGGRMFATESVDELHGAFAELLDELSNQYLIGYPPTNTTRNDEWREIRVQVDGHSGVRARQGYRATPYK